MERSELTGIVLAGGKSSRMGSEKGLVRFRGKPLVQYGIDLLVRYAGRVLISTVHPGYNRFGLETVPDDFAGRGPAAGIAAALKNTKTEWNLVLACDLPFLEPDLIDLLLDNRKDYLAVIPVHGSQKEPLAGLYHRSVGVIFEEAITLGNHALYAILEKCSVKYLDTDRLLEKYPRLFTNFNTPGEMGFFQANRQA
jgi:molybdopterin-guanine dinucleotide biosynthesis protein A